MTGYFKLGGNVKLEGGDKIFKNADYCKCGLNQMKLFISTIAFL